MRHRGGLALVIGCTAVAGAPARAQSAIAREGAEPEGSVEESIDTATEEAWSCSITIAVYIVPDSHEYVQPTVKADLGSLHLEARYNYEALDTASVFVGWNFSFGEELTLDITPMVGAVFGETSGLAPGVEATLSWRQLELYTEAEYVFDSSDDEGNFFYMWSELSWYPVESFRIGIVGQRTRAYESDLDVQRGLLAGVTLGTVDLTAYIFNLGEDEDPTLALSATLTF